MAARVSEAFVLQTFPFKEGDLIVSFLTRDLGKLRGVARRARRPKSGFGSGLERLSQIQMSYFQRENRELVSLDSCELVQSQFSVLNDFSCACALDFFAEVTEQILPPAEPAEKYFRLLTSVLEFLRSGAPGAAWRSVTYFSLWTVRLAGLLPDLDSCLSCGSAIEAQAWFERHRHGVFCSDCRRAYDIRGAWELTAESRQIAEEMLRTPVSRLAERAWTQGTARDLRRFLAQQIESHIERKLITFPVLEAAA